MLRTILLLGAAAIAFGQSTFEVATLKLNVSGTTSMKFPVPSNGRFSATNINLKTLISYAYNVQGFGVEGAPGWANSDRYDVNAKAAEATLSREQYQTMLRALLEERFNLAVHRERKDMQVYSLVAAKSGVKLKSAEEGGCVAAGAPVPARAVEEPAPITCGTFFTGPSSLDGRKLSLAVLANYLSIVLGRPVSDNTGIAGTFDVHLEFSPEGVNLGQGPAGLATDAVDADGRPSIFSALQEQLGLRLESKKEPGEVLVIDRVERVPAEN